MLNWFERWMLKNILSKIIQQSHRHERDITSLYQMIYDRARYVFYEDNQVTLESFLDDCYKAGKRRF